MNLVTLGVRNQTAAGVGFSRGVTVGIRALGLDFLEVKLVLTMEQSKSPSYPSINLCGGLS